MIKKLRLKFILLSMVSLLIVLLIIMGCINLISYGNIIDRADTTLSLLAAHRGSFPQSNEPKGGFPKAMSPETPFETRFFSVVLRADGSIANVDTGKIAAVDTEAAIAYAEQIYSTGDIQGFADSYRYLRTAEADGYRFIFIDCSRDLTTWRSFLVTSCLISLVGLLAVLVLMIAFSGKIIKPVSESFEKQKRFITDAGHELKTPLSVIDADASVLELEAGENEWLTDIQKQTRRLAALTNDLISLSRMEEENSQWQKLDFPLSDVVAETAQSFQAVALTQEKTLSCDIAPLLTFHGEEAAIRRLVSILLDNSLKYSPVGSSISLTLEKQNKFFRLSVTNTAENLNTEQLSHLFDRFYRADSSRSTGGYGLGLSIANAIVQAHKGKISAVRPEKNRLQINVLLPA